MSTLLIAQNDDLFTLKQTMSLLCLPILCMETTFLIGGLRMIEVFSLPRQDLLAKLEVVKRGLKT